MIFSSLRSFPPLFPFPRRERALKSLEKEREERGEPQFSSGRKRRRRRRRKGVCVCCVSLFPRVFPTIFPSSFFLSKKRKRKRFRCLLDPSSSAPTRKRREEGRFLSEFIFLPFTFEFFWGGNQRACVCVTYWVSDSGGYFSNACGSGWKKYSRVIRVSLEKMGRDRGIRKCFSLDPVKWYSSKQEPKEREREREREKKKKRGNSSGLFWPPYYCLWPKDSADGRSRRKEIKPSCFSRPNKKRQKCSKTKRENQVRPYISWPLLTQENKIKQHALQVNGSVPQTGMEKKIIL